MNRNKPYLTIGLAILAFGSIFGTINDTIDLITPRLAIGSTVICLLFCILLVLITKFSEYRSTILHDKTGTIKSDIFLYAIGFIIIIWIPALFQTLGISNKTSPIVTQMTHNNIDNSDEISTLFNPRKETFKILLLPFNPDKNCNVFSTDYETQLIERYEQLKNDSDLEIALSPNKICPSTFQEAQEIGEKENADLVIWGNYEEEPNGKTKIRLRYTAVETNYIGDKETKGDTDKKTLIELNDLRKGYLQEDIDYILYWTLAEKEKSRGNYKVALRYLSFINHNPCDINIRINKAECYIKTHQLDKVDYELSKCDDSNSDILLLKAKLEWARKDIKKAINSLCIAINSNQSYLREFSLDHAIIFLKRQNLKVLEIQNTLDSCIEINELALGLGKFYYYQSNIDSSIYYLNQVSDTSNISLAASEYLTRCWADKLDFTKAHLNYKKVLENKGDTSLIEEIIRNKAIHFESLELLDSASYYYDELILNNFSSSYNYIQRASFYDQKLNRYEKALNDYNKAINLNHYSWYIRNRADFFEKNKKYLESIEDWKRLIKLSPRKIDHYKYISELYRKVNNDERANFYLDKALEIEPYSAEDYFHFSKVYEQKKDIEESINVLSKGIEKYPKHSLLYISRGDFFYELKKFKRAIQDCSEVIKLDSNYAGAYNIRGLSYCKFQQYDKAVSDFEAAHKISPNSRAIKSNLEFSKREKLYSKWPILRYLPHTLGRIILLFYISIFFWGAINHFYVLNKIHYKKAHDVYLKKLAKERKIKDKKNHYAKIKEKYESIINRANLYRLFEEQFGMLASFLFFLMFIFHATFPIAMFSDENINNSDDYINLITNAYNDSFFEGLILLVSPLSMLVLMIAMCLYGRTWNVILAYFATLERIKKTKNKRFNFYALHILTLICSRYSISIFGLQSYGSDLLMSQHGIVYFILLFYFTLNYKFSVLFSDMDIKNYGTLKKAKKSHL